MVHRYSATNFQGVSRVPFEIEVDEEAQRYEVRYSGSVSVEERMKVVAQVFAMANLTGIRRVLVDFRNASCLVTGFDPSNRLASRLAQETVGFGGKVAYVARSDLQVDLIMEQMAEVRGIPFRRFTEMSAAKAWLSAVS